MLGRLFMTDRRFRVRDLRNGQWFWIHKEALGLISKELGSGGIAVYNWLSYFANSESQACYPAIDTLAKNCKYSPRYIIKILNQLEGLKLISIERQRGKVNIYSLLKVASEFTGELRDIGTRELEFTTTPELRDIRTRINEQELIEQYNRYAAHLNILSQIRNYSHQSEIDITMLERLSERHSLNSSELLQILQDYSIAKLDKPLEKGDNPRLQINTFCRNYKRWHSKKNYQNDNGKPKKGLIASLK